MAVAEAFSRLTVADAVGESSLELPTLHQDMPLQVAARVLEISGSPALAVTDGGQHVVGLFTAGDVARAYFEGVLPTGTLGRWLASGMASAPARFLQRLTVRLSESLAQVADRIVANAMCGDCTCHHMVVRREPGKQFSVLSTLDMVRALVQSEPGTCSEDKAGKTIFHIMKHRDAIITCPPSSSVKDVLRILLHSRQTAVLITDKYGPRGVFTARKAVQAFACSVPGDSKVGELSLSLRNRIIEDDKVFMEAATLMAERAVDHLVVLHPRSSEIVGLLSSLDMVLCTRPRVPLVRPAWSRTRPVVGNLVGHDGYPTPVCCSDSTLGTVAQLLELAGRSTAVVSPDLGMPLGALTDHDLLWALAGGWTRDARVKDWLLARQSREPRLHGHLLVPLSTPVVDAAKLMLSTSVHGHGPCHSLAVQAPNGCWLGIFSALDVGRALCSLGSRLDEWKAGADRTPVCELMGPAAPCCSPGDELLEVLARLADSAQSCALVCEAGAFRGVVTPRCAVRLLAAGAPEGRSVAAWLHRRPHSGSLRCVGPEARLLDAAALMVKHRFHHLVVARAAGEPLGVISSLDVLRGVVSLSCNVPCVSLRSLALSGGPACYTVSVPESTAASAAPA